MNAPWFRVAAESRWTAIQHIESVRPDLRPLVLRHVEHLDCVMDELRGHPRRAA